MLPQWLIEKKRDGGALTDAEIRNFVLGFTRGEIPDYQMAALAMAIYFRGLTLDETVALTEAMTRSGDRVDTSALNAPKIDKHSTGGIGDKVSLLLAPLAACCGLAVPMIAGRGLGITGGTLDKLDGIPGYRTRLPVADFLRVVAACGCAIVGQTDRLAPADRKLYALRDVTGTVPSLPLITASILSKKLAAGLDGLVMDVKCGRGAFMPTPAAARELGRLLLQVGRRLGLKMSVLITNVDQPLGRAVGNTLEVVETIAALQGRGPEDVVEVTLALGERMLILGGLAHSTAEAGALLARQLESGAAWRKFLEMVRLQGGDPATLEHPERLPRARLREPFPAPASGFVARVDADRIGRACLLLGAGRAEVSAGVDHAVGLTGLVKVGEAVVQGQPLAVLEANDEDKLAAARTLLPSAFHLAPEAPPAPWIIGEEVTA